MKDSIKATVTACVMCSAALAAWRPLEGVLCRSPVCAGRHLALPAASKCPECTRPLTTPQLARGHCESALCREEVLRGRREKESARKAALLVSLQRRRTRAAAQRGMSRDEQDTYKAALLPRNLDRASRLTPRRRTSHEAHLRACLAEAREHLATSKAPFVVEAAPVIGAPTAAQRAESQLLLAGCAACRGQCCREGGDHAFLSVDSMTAYLQRFPAADDDAVVVHHMQHIGEQTMTHGCVYQGVRGCTLAPELRADICHRFHCTGLMMLKGQFAAGEPIRAYVMHRRGERLSGGRFIEIASTGDPATAEQGAAPPVC